MYATVDTLLSMMSENFKFNIEIKDTILPTVKNLIRHCNALCFNKQQ